MNGQLSMVSKLDEETFEDEKAREEYFTVCKEVMLYNVTPFMKSLYAEFKPLVGAIEKVIPK